MIASPTLRFHDGNAIPQLGFGVFKVSNEDAATAVQKALEAGYRHLDTATIYGNEEGVRRGIDAAGVDPKDIFITTKLWNDDQGYDSTLRAFDASMQRLGLDTLDLYLIHWPCPAKNGLFKDTWRAFTELQKQGRIRSIGVSNFRLQDLDELMSSSESKPVINQIELHPYFTQKELRAKGAQHDILTEAWGPLGQGRGILEDAALADIARAHDASPGQVVLAWHRQIGNVVIPKSVTPSRIVENFQSLELELTQEELMRISSLDKRAEGRGGGHPDELN